MSVPLLPETVQLLPLQAEIERAASKAVVSSCWIPALAEMMALEQTGHHQPVSDVLAPCSLVKATVQALLALLQCKWHSGLDEIIT